MKKMRIPKMKINELDSKYFLQFKQVMAYCPKCGTTDGGDWSCCKGKCPLDASPHFDKLTEDKHKAKNITT